MQIPVYDYASETNTFRQDILRGLRKPRKELYSKYFYDEKGAQLFEQITELEEYYPTRTELAIMQNAIEEITDLLGSDCLLVEYGSGSSWKTRILLDHLVQPTAYVPIDISKEHLTASAQALAEAYPEIEILPVCADYTSDFQIPDPGRPAARTVVYYPGSTIGNFDPEPARLFLSNIAKVSRKGGLLIGVDLKKDFNVLHRAYNDQEGITAEFNLNLLRRINREMGADIPLEQFSHYAFYNPSEGRIEMHLASLKDQRVQIDGTEISFTQGESIWTESSYKYTLAEFGDLARRSGFEVRHVWVDLERLFSVQYLTVING